MELCNFVQPGLYIQMDLNPFSNQFSNFLSSGECWGETLVNWIYGHIKNVLWVFLYSWGSLLNFGPVKFRLFFQKTLFFSKKTFFSKNIYFDTFHSNTNNNDSAVGKIQNSTDITRQIQLLEIDGSGDSTERGVGPPRVSSAGGISKSSMRPFDM